MRIVMNGWFWNRADVGLGQYIRWLVWGLLQSKTMLEIILVAPQEFRPQPQMVFGRFTDKLNLDNLTLLVKPTPFPNQAAPLARLWFEQVTFPNSCKELRPDIIHVPYYGAPLRSVKPLAVTAHDLIPLILPEYRTDPLLRLYGRLITAGLPKADLLLTPSQAAKHDIHQHLHIPTNRIQVIYEAPAPLYKHCSRDSASTIQQKYNLPACYILYVGGYERRKNIGTLLRAFHQAQPHLQPETCLVLAGKTPEKDTAIRPNPKPLIQQLKLQDQVYLPGWIPETDLPELYRRAELFVYPSHYEGFGLPVLEAMACGTAVLTTTAASLTEIAGSAAAFVPPDDIYQMAQKIVQLCNDKENNWYLAQSGLNHVKQFCWQKTAAKTIEAFQDIL